MTMPKNLTLEQQIEWRKKQVERAKQWANENPDKVRRNKRNYYDKNKEKVIAASAQWKLNNPVRYKLSTVRFQEKHREKLLKRSREYYAANREAKLEYHRQYRLKNADAVSARIRRSQKKNPLRLRIAKHKRRSREFSGKITVTKVKDLLVSQSNKCVYCCNELSEYHVDHITPLSRGGNNNDENIQLLCPRCNRKKGNRLVSELKEYWWI